MGSQEVLPLQNMLLRTWVSDCNFQSTWQKTTINTRTLGRGCDSHWRGKLRRCDNQYVERLDDFTQGNRTSRDNLNHTVSVVLDAKEIPMDCLRVPSYLPNIFSNVHSELPTCCFTPNIIISPPPLQFNLNLFFPEGRRKVMSINGPAFKCAMINYHL